MHDSLLRKETETYQNCPAGLTAFVLSIMNYGSCLYGFACRTMRGWVRNKNKFNDMKNLRVTRAYSLILHDEQCTASFKFLAVNKAKGDFTSFKKTKSNRCRERHGRLSF